MKVGIKVGQVALKKASKKLKESNKILDKGLAVCFDTMSASLSGSDSDGSQKGDNEPPEENVEFFPPDDPTDDS
jgi:hypothetical protein